MVGTVGMAALRLSQNESVAVASQTEEIVGHECPDGPGEVENPNVSMRARARVLV
jgi:hypothetical protein